MSGYEDHRDALRRVVLTILATGTSLSDVIDMFASILRAEAYAEEADLISDVAFVRRDFE